MMLGDGQWTELVASSGSTASSFILTNAADGPIELWWINTSGNTVKFATLQSGESITQSTFVGHNWILKDADDFFLKTINITSSAQSTYTYGPDLADSIDGGSGNDTIYAQYGNDTVSGGSGNDWVSLGSGNDSFGGFSTDAGNDTVYGGAGDDYIVGGADSDRLYGEDGNDTLSGGTGEDLLYGGAGNDHFWITDDHNGDTIYGGTGWDLVNYSNFISTSGVSATFSGNGAGTYAYATTNAAGSFSEIEGVAGTGYNDTIDASATSDGLSIWGLGGNDRITGGSGNDYFLGEDGNDTLIGGAGADTLFGGSGNDSIMGGDGADHIHGEAGNDYLSGGADGDAFWFVSGAGVDTIDGGSTGNDQDTMSLWATSSAPVTVNFTGAEAGAYAYTGGGSGSFTDIETLWLTDGNDTVNGAASTAGMTIGANDGNDSITGGSGNDYLEGGTGNDTLKGGAGNDALTGGAGADSLGGGDGNDTINGDAGADNLLGGTGNDYISGGADNDTIWVYANEGTDTIDGGSTGTDSDTLFLWDTSQQPVTVTFTGAEAGTYSFASGGSGSFTDIEVFWVGNGNDTFNGSASTAAMSLNGNAGNDLLIGGSANDSLYGGAGNDTLTGGAGNDILVGDDGDDLFQIADTDGNDIITGGTGIDTIVYSSTSSTQGVWVTSSGNTVGSYSFLGTSGYGTFNEIEAFTGTNYADTLDGSNYTSGITLSGLGGNDAIYGGSGADSLDGGTGDDTIYALAGNDTIIGGAGADTIDGGTGNDSISGGDDADKFLVYSAEGVDTIDGGSGGNDHDKLWLYDSNAAAITVTFTGDEAGTYTFGSGGGGSFTEIEEITLSDGNNVVNGSASTAAIIVGGGSGNDLITGGSGNDTFYGGTGNDTLNGGAGDDALYSGAGNDTLTGDAGDDKLYASSGNDALDGGTGNDTLDGGTGTDTLTGGAGNDTLTGGLNDDTFILANGSGADRITDFDMTMAGGKSTDQLDVSGLLRGDGSAITWADVTVTDTNGDGTGDAILTFPDGTSVILQGVTADQVDGKSEMAAIGIPCFVTGTPILTPKGWRAVEGLARGDLVQTPNGPAPIIWRGSRYLTAADLHARPEDRPVHFEVGAIGNTAPLRLSGQHAVQILRADGQPALVRARHLAATGLRGVRIAQGVTHVGYHHILLDRHAIVTAGGALVESLYPGPQALRALPWEQRLQIAAAVLTSTHAKARIDQSRPLTLRDLPAAYGPRVCPLLRRSEVTQSLRVAAWSQSGKPTRAI